jgi:hypothetical protein
MTALRSISLKIAAKMSSLVTVTASGSNSESWGAGGTYPIWSVQALVMTTWPLFLLPFIETARIYDEDITHLLFLPTLCLINYNFRQALIDKTVKRSISFSLF